MRIPKFFHPILGMLTGAILFIAGIALVSLVFVVAFKAIDYAKPYALDFASSIHQFLNSLQEWLHC